MTAAALTGPWLNGRQAARILQLDPRQVPRLAAEGRIATRDLEGVRARYSTADVIALARQGRRPAAAV